MSVIDVSAGQSEEKVAQLKVGRSGETLKTQEL